ncbi:MAG: hypothetical protein DMG13_21620 [Acidobacteria bacterium]|nr:MAG: hypothetical protein DMG13_21620 [Acidobacteriota bacterium]
MLYDTTVHDASFVKGRPPAEIHALLSWTRHRLGLHDATEWRLISARRKLGKILFEIEEDTPSGSRRLIGKFGSPERATRLYRALKLLRETGFAPPNRCTVPEPVAFVADRGFVLQEKVPGEHALPLLIGSHESIPAASACADWLRNLHYCRVPAETSAPNPRLISTWAAELIAAEQSESTRIHKIAGAILNQLNEPASEPFPSHGDFHPMNIFIAETGRITGIDMDKFGLREPESDVGWFLMQTAGLGFFKKQSFDHTEKVRRGFLEHYQEGVRRSIQPRRVALYMAMAFLKNLHFELVLLKTGRTDYAEPWLWAAASAILEGNLHLSP